MSIFAELRAGIVTTSAEQTRQLGARLAAVLPPDSTLALHGNLGTGKTTFVQGLARGFGITDPVTSPTFNIFHLYRRAPALDAPARPEPTEQGEGRPVFHSPSTSLRARLGEGGPVLRSPSTSLRAGLGEGGRTLAHLDAYRLENAHQVAELMLEDFLVSPYCLAIEWPERIAPWLPADALHLTLGIEAPGRHRVALL